MTLIEGQTGIAEFTANELYARILNNEATFILDVRNEDEFKRSPVEGQSN
ncbi:MAG: MBL fold metallo-hydrolase, partial [Chloroflexia bacterium]|nr:MBL fold metallo-hydrolase [Chloroflexia bacterium]